MKFDLSYKNDQGIRLVKGEDTAVKENETYLFI